MNAMSIEGVIYRLAVVADEATMSGKEGFERRAFHSIPTKHSHLCTVVHLHAILGQRKGDLLEMNPVGSRMRIEYSIPSRCLFGYRSEFMSATHGEGVINTLFEGYQPHRGGIIMRFTGALVASEAGVTTRYGLFNTQERGQLFVGPQTEVYEGMIVGENPKNDDISVNPCKEKHLTAIRSAGADEKLLLTPPKIFSLEEAIEFIADDELIEVTPKSIRLRKKILDTSTRMREMVKARRALENNN